MLAYPTKGDKPRSTSSTKIIRVTAILLFAVLDIIREQSREASFVRVPKGRSLVFTCEASLLTGSEKAEILGVDARDVLPLDETGSL